MNDWENEKSPGHLRSKPSRMRPHSDEASPPGIPVQDWVTQHTRTGASVEDTLYPMRDGEVLIRLSSVDRKAWRRTGNNIAEITIEEAFKILKSFAEGNTP